MRAARPRPRAFFAGTKSPCRSEACLCLFRSGSDDDATICNNCPAGYHQDQSAGAACLPCIPGRHQKEQGQQICEECKVNFYASKSNSTECKRCILGKTTNGAEGTSTCQDCIAGQYGDSSGTCNNCDKGKYRKGGINSSLGCLPCKLVTTLQLHCSKDIPLDVW